MIIARTCQVRPARRADLHGIIALDALHGRRPKPDYWARALRAHAPASRDKGHIAYVAVDYEDRIVGFLFGTIRAWEFGSAPCGWIFAIAVSPAYERCGLGTRLCEQAEKKFRSLGVRRIRTMVRRDDVPLLAYFRSMGFVAGPFVEMELKLPAEAASTP